MQIEATDTEKGLGNEVKKLERFQDNEKKKKKKKIHISEDFGLFMGEGKVRLCKHLAQTHGSPCAGTLPSLQ